MNAMVKALGLIALAMVILLVDRQSPGSHAQFPQNPSAPQIAEEARLDASLVELFKLRKFNEALSVGTQLLDLRQKMFGAEDPAIATSLSNLGEIYLAKKDDGKADPLYRRAVAILQKKPGTNPTLLSAGLTKLAYMRFRKRDYVGAATFLEQAVAVKEKAVGKEDLSIAGLLHDLADVYQTLHRLEVAEQLYVRSLTIMEQQLGRDHPDTISNMMDYGCLISDQLISNHQLGKIEKPDEREKAQQALRGRARCWLFGFAPDCAIERSEVNYALDDVLNGKAVSLPRPGYPVEARRAHAQGRMVVAVLIDEEGRVIKAKAICGGHQSLRAPSVSSALAARFTPTTVQGKPTKVTGIITYYFVMQ